MTISTAVIRNDYTGNGVNATFAYTFPIFADADLEVYVAGVLRTLTTHYTVTGAGEAAGGNVVFTAGNIPASAAAVAIVSAVPETQETDFVEKGPFPADTVEEALDRAVRLVQQANEAIGRALKFAKSSTTADVDVPALSASRYLRVNAAGTGLEWVALTTTALVVSAFIETLLDDVDAATARSTLGAQAQDADLDALAALAVAGLLARTGAGTAAARTIIGTANQITVTNGDGVSGNPTLATPQNLHTGATPEFAGLIIGGTGAITPAAVSGTPAQHALFRENVLKGWVKFSVAGAVQDSFNVLSITDTGAGDWTVNWDRDFATANYVAGVSHLASSDAGIHDRVSGVRAQAAGTTQIKTFVTLTAGASESEISDLFVFAIGDQ